MLMLTIYTCECIHVNNLVMKYVYFILDSIVTYHFL